MSDSILKVLIIDDSPEDRVTFRRLLLKNELRSYKFYEAETGADALAICRSVKPDCVLLDFDLPDMSGAEILRELEREYGANKIPVVVISGNKMIENAVASLKQGAQDFLVKGSVTTADLIRAIENAIEKVSLVRRREHAESERRNSEERYRELFNSIDEGFCVIEVLLDANGKPDDYIFLETNPAFQKQTGLTDALGKTARELVPDLEDQWFETYGKVALTGESKRFIDEAVSMNRWFDVYAFKIGEMSNLKIAVLFTDITAGKLSELALQESEEHLRYTVELNPQIPWTANMHGGIESFSESWLELTGMTRAAALGEGWQNVQHPEDGSAMRAAWTRSIKTGEAYDVEHRVKLYNGSYRWMRSRAFPRRNAAGEIVRWYGSTEDIETRKAAELTRRESEARLKMAIEIGSMSAFEWNPQTDEIYREINDADIFGLPPAAGRLDSGAEFLKRIHRADRDDYARLMKSLTPDNDAYKTAYRIVKPDESVVWLEESGRAFFDQNDRFVKLIGITVDVTEKIQRERELEGLYAREQVLRREAESANRAKDEFLAILSHELRSPLNAMSGWVTMLQKGMLSGDSAKHAVNVIERNVRLQATLIADLLDVSRIITGKMKLEPTDLNFNSIVETAIETVRPSADAKNISIERHFAAPDCEISGDAFRLQQVVGNLLTNAVKFTPENGHIFVGLSLPSKDTVRLTIRDTGCGIDADLLPHVFDRFQQADASTRRKYGGLGLGLAIVNSLVELHDGRVRAESEGEGKGATFTVDLPLAKAVEPASERRSNGKRPNESEIESDKILEGIKVLIVDDEIDSLELLSFVLRHKGAEVQSAFSARDALKSINASPPDILISDIGMAEMDGLDFIRQVRNMPGKTNSDTIPAIALTGFAGNEDRDRALEAGFQLHLQKPVDVTGLPLTVKSLVRPK